MILFLTLSSAQSSYLFYVYSIWQHSFYNTSFYLSFGYLPFYSAGPLFLTLVSFASLSERRHFRPDRPRGRYRGVAPGRSPGPLDRAPVSWRGALATWTEPRSPRHNSGPLDRALALGLLDRAALAPWAEPRSHGHSSGPLDRTPVSWRLLWPPGQNPGPLEGALTTWTELWPPPLGQSFGPLDTALAT